MSSPLRVGVAGLGTVGAAVLDILARRNGPLAERCGRAIVVAGVGARSRDKARGIDLSSIPWHDDPVALARSPDIDCLVELIGGEGGPALAATRAALAAGKHVVTANKAMLAHHGVELAEAAECRGVALKFEAAIAGGIPIVKALREGLVGNRNRARLRHPQRHLQLHLVPDGGGEALFRRVPRGRAGGWAMPRPTRPSTSAGSIPPTSWRS